MRDAASVLPGHVLLQAVWAKPVLGQAVSRAPMGCSRPPRLPLVLLVLLVLAPAPAVAWDSVDLELFDLVEEVPQNFYAFLGVEQVRETRGPGSSRPGGGDTFSLGAGPATLARARAELWSNANPR